MLVPSLNELRDHHLIIDQYADQETNTQTYSFDLLENSLSQLNLMTKEPRQHVMIYGENSAYFFVYYDHDQHREISWAGSEQFSLDKMYFGLISKADYWNSKANYIPFKMISKSY